ncbi:MAG: pyridoxamine 5'-phosphate oxidase [Sphingomicrobium sp.]
MADDPFALFDAWFAEARLSEPNDPDAMALATVGADGRPSVRMVLLKGTSDGGFTFHTNSLSRKGQDMAANDRVAAVLHWKSLRRQIRIEGRVTAASDAESDAYFASRGRPSQASAWASLQSQPLASRAELERRQAGMELRFGSGDVPRPPHWHGYRIDPDTIEFWSDGAHRLHNRRLFTRRADGGWDEGLLFP